MCVCPLECLIHPVVEEWVVISFVHLEPLHQVHDVGQDDAARGQWSAVGVQVGPLTYFRNHYLVNYCL